MQNGHAKLIISIVSFDIDPESDILTKGLKIANIDSLQWKIGDQVLRQAPAKYFG